MMLLLIRDARGQALKSIKTVTKPSKPIPEPCTPTTSNRKTRRSPKPQTLESPTLVSSTNRRSCKPSPAQRKRKQAQKSQGECNTMA